jgi:hypothetical protein
MYSWSVADVIELPDGMAARENWTRLRRFRLAFRLRTRMVAWFPKVPPESSSLRWVSAVEGWMVTVAAYATPGAQSQTPSRHRMPVDLTSRRATPPIASFGEFIGV